MFEGAIAVLYLHLLSALLFVPVFLLNLAHLRYRRIPLYSWGTVIAVIHLAAGFLSFVLLPIAAVVISIVVEIANAMMSDDERNKLSKQFDQEIKQTEAQIEAAQSSYEELHCLITYTVEQDYDYRQALKKLEHAGIWNYVRGGLITSILVKPADAEKAAACLGLESSTDVADPAPDAGG